MQYGVMGSCWGWLVRGLASGAIAVAFAVCHLQIFFPISTRWTFTNGGLHVVGGCLALLPMRSVEGCKRALRICRDITSVVVMGC